MHSETSKKVPRTCTVVYASSADEDWSALALHKPESRPIADFRSSDAYVLLGDPGAGKTTAFEDEAEQLGDEARLVSARDFLGLDDPGAASTEGTLFIDGLDEVRAGQRDARSPLDRIRRRLRKLGQPRFRLSCREADWLGENDRKHLAQVSPNGEVTILRLDPLTDQEIEAVLGGHAAIENPSQFLWTARERGLDVLLTNPLTLRLLIRVVAGGDEWPGSRVDAFEKACLVIVREYNAEHVAAAYRKPSHPPEKLLEVAGHLCAVQLLTGASGFSLLEDGIIHHGYDVHYLDPDQCNYASPALLRHALSTKLFTGLGDGRMVPIHRHIAEYLAARYMARLVDERKLPVSRIVALIVGQEDGTVVSEMRGVSGWLAAQCAPVRPHLIDRDPIGVGVYGDIRGFSHQDKQALLESLGRAIPWHGWDFGVAASFRALVTPDMARALDSLFDGPSCSIEHQRFVGFLLKVLAESAPVPELGESLLRMVRDPTWRSEVRADALVAYGCHGRDDDEADRLLALLEDIRRGRMKDPDYDLLGILLGQLYPGKLSPHELWKFFVEPQHPDQFGPAYVRFWGSDLAAVAPDSDLADHLDHFGRQPRSLLTHQGVDRLQRLRLALVTRALTVHGDDLIRQGKTARIYDWLGVGSAGRLVRGDHDGWVNEIREWMAERPRAQKAVILESLKRHLDDDAPAPSFEVRKRLYGSALPPDFGEWCLKQAIEAEGESPQAAEYLLERAFHAIENDRINRNLSLDAIRKGVRHSGRLRTALARLRCSSDAATASEAEWAASQTEYERKVKEEKTRELDYLRSQEAALASGQAPPGLLYNLARIYFGDFRGIAVDADVGPRAIQRYCAGAHSLAEAILTGIRGVSSRPDLPTLREVARIAREGRFHYLGLPFLACLAEADRTSPVTTAVPQYRHLAVAFYFANYLGEYEPDWYATLLDRHPGIIADVQMRLASAVYRSTQSVDCKLHELAFDPRYAQVAQHSVLHLLRAFPTQCKRAFGQHLDYLLLAGLRHSDHNALREIIDAKLSRSSLAVWQRTHWLATGLFGWPGSFADNLRHHVQGRQRRLAELSVFVSQPGLADRVDSRTAGLLVQLLGSSVEPEQWSVRYAGVRTVTAGMQRSRLVRGLIDWLASSPSPEAHQALTELTDDETVSAWREVLGRALETQRVVRRDHGYRHPDVEQVLKTLRGAEPATVGDLAALVELQLSELAVEMRYGDTDGWRAFWNEGRYRTPTTPRSEESCRDTIVRELQRRLPSGVEIHAEAHHAGGRRSDIRASYLASRDERFHVPIEIKKSDHRDLWTAIHGQLISKYAIDPAAKGHGVYLVLWFGREHAKRLPSGNLPASATELEQRLRDSLSDIQKRKITVCVVDVTAAAPICESVPV